MLKYQIQ